MELQKKIDLTGKHNVWELLFEQTDWWAAAFWGIVVLAFWMRFHALGDMPLHHDESQYGTYCWRLFKGEGYRYDPMLHGPFLFHFQAIIFFLFGVSNYTVRIAPALFGGLLVASTYLLRDTVGKRGIVLIALFLNFSPTHLYYSRFMIHDSHSAFFTYAFALCGVRYFQTRQRKWLYLTAAALSVMFCIKANAYIHAFVVVTFLLIMLIFEHLMTRLPRFRSDFAPQFTAYLEQRFPGEYSQPLLTRLLRYLRDEKDALILAGFVFAWIYLFLYSTFFTNPNGVYDGIVRTWTYWLNQHNIQRIKGPFHYYVSFFALYEISALLIACGGILQSISTTFRRTLIAVWLTLLFGYTSARFGMNLLPLPPANLAEIKTMSEKFHFMTAWLASAVPFREKCASLAGIAFKIAHMEFYADVFLTIYVLLLGLWGTFHFLARRERLTALFTYWSAIGFLIYAYAGEKVPWLFLHVVMPVLVLAGIMLRKFLLASFWRNATIRLENFAQTAAILLDVAIVIYALDAIFRLIYFYPARPDNWAFAEKTLLTLILPVLAGILLHLILTASFWKTEEIGIAWAKAAAIAAGGILAAYTLHAAILLNYYNRANPVERMVYTQTSTDMLMMLDVFQKKKFAIGADEARKPVIAVQGEATWPLAWYLRDEEGWYFPGDLHGIDRPMVVIDWEKREEYRDVLRDYQEIRVKLREWWIPGDNGTLNDWWQYVMYRKVFNPTGSTDVAFYVKR